MPEVLREVQEEAGGGGLLSDQLDLLRGAICTIVLHLHSFSSFPSFNEWLHFGFRVRRRRSCPSEGSPKWCSARKRMVSLDFCSLKTVSFEYVHYVIAFGIHVLRKMFGKWSVSMYVNDGKYWWQFGCVCSNGWRTMLNTFPFWIWNWLFSW